MTKLTEADKGRIALKIVIHRMVKVNKIPDQNGLKRELPNMANDLNEELEVLHAFAQEILPEVIRRRLGCESVSIIW